MLKNSSMLKGDIRTPLRMCWLHTIPPVLLFTIMDRNASQFEPSSALS